MTIDLQPRSRSVPAPGGHARASEAPLVTTPAPRDVWREFLAGDPAGLVTQSPEWLDALVAAGYEDASRLYEMPWGTRLVLPLGRRARPLPRSVAPRVSMPEGWGMGGVLASAPLEPRDVAAVAADLAADPAVVTQVRPNPLHAELWDAGRPPGTVVIPRRAHVLDLSGGPDVVWKERFRSTTRNRIRKAEQAGLEIECDATGRLLPVYYALFELSVERWAEQQNEPVALARWRAHRRDPLEKFRRLAATLGASMRVWVAWKDGTPVATTIVLQGRNAHRTRAAMDRDAGERTYAGELLEWLAIQEACAAGCNHFHFGESGWSRSLSQYKEKFGARPVEYAEYRFERLPLTRADALARSAVKRALRFRDAA